MCITNYKERQLFYFKSMAKINVKDFISYRKGLASDSEKQAVWQSEESTHMLLKQWESANELNEDSEMPDVEGMLATLHKQMYRPILTLPWFKRIAAVLLLPLALGLTWYMLFHYDTLIEVKTVNAEIKNVMLPDNTTVWLNSASQLKYPQHFSSDGREVILTGEAYFDVQHNTDYPFLVNVGGLQVKVLGTKFNCSAYDDEETVRISLLEGKVAVKHNGQRILLMPDEEIVLTKATNELRKQGFNAGRVMAWKEGRLIFRNAGFEEIARRLSRHYDYSVTIDEGLEEHRFSLTLKNESIKEALDLIKMTAPIDYTINEKQVSIMKEKEHVP
jgi:ferric-dicitrate binding protein FerR (iron transport regulator)